MSFLSDQITKIVRNTLTKYAKEFGVGRDKVALWISYQKTIDGGYPQLAVLNKPNEPKKIEFGDVTRMVDLAGYFKKLMTRVAKEKDIPVEEQCYFIRDYGSEVVMFFYINGKQTVFDPQADDREDKIARYRVPLEYILQS